MMDVSLLKDNIEMAKESIADLIRSNPSLAEVASSLKEINKGMIFRYIGNTSGEKADVVISPTELGNLSSQRSN